MTVAVRLHPETLRSFNSTGLTGTLQALGTPLGFPSSILKIVNNSTSLVTISWDGVNAHDILPASSFALYDICSDTQREEGLYIAQGTQFYVSGSAGTGLIYLASFYAQ